MGGLPCAVVSLPLAAGTPSSAPPHRRGISSWYSDLGEIPFAIAANKPPALLLAAAGGDPDYQG